MIDVETPAIAGVSNYFEHHFALKQTFTGDGIAVLSENRGDDSMMLL